MLEQDRKALKKGWVEVLTILRWDACGLIKIMAPTDSDMNDDMDTAKLSKTKTRLHIKVKDDRTKKYNLVTGQHEGNS